MKTFGIDIDSRDTTELLEAAKAVTPAEIAAAREEIQPLFAEPIPVDPVSDRSIALYLAIRKVVEENEWETYTIQSFPGLGDEYSATCFVLAPWPDSRASVRART